MIFLLIIAHLIADFYLQSSKMAENKKTSFKTLLAHSVVYLAVFAIVDFVFLQAISAVWTTLIIATSHFVIDFARTKIESNCKCNKSFFVTFLIDQALHLTVIIVTYCLFNLLSKVNYVYEYCEANSNFIQILAYCLLFVALLNPASVFIKKMFAFLFKEDPNNEPGNNAGNMIGKLERTITAILLLCNQFAAIGLVITAKSIARFKQLEDQNFAEKYLIGTLLSLTVSLVLTIVLKTIFSL